MTNGSKLYYQDGPSTLTSEYIYNSVNQLTWENQENVAEPEE